MNYTTVSIKETRNNLAELIERAALAQESFLVTKFGKPKALIVSAQNWAADKDNKDAVLKATAGLWAGRKSLKISREKESSRYEKIFG